MKIAVRKLLERLGYRIVRLPQQRRQTDPKSFAVEEIGMRSTLRGLKYRGYRPLQIIDAGAADGGWSRMCMEYFPEAAYFLIEPMSERAIELQALQAQHPKVSYLSAAIGEAVGESEIGISSDLYGTSFHHPGLERRRIAVTTLDRLLEERAFRPPDFIKLDLQGHEWYALSGASRCLESCRLVLSECILHPYAKTMKLMGDIVDLLRQHHFMPYEVVDTLRRAHSGAMGQCDLLFIKEGDPLIDDKHFIYPETGTFFRKCGDRGPNLCGPLPLCALCG